MTSAVTTGLRADVGTIRNAVARLSTDLVGRHDEIEAARRLPDDVAAGLRATGVYRSWLPRELGGAEAEPASVIGAVRSLAAADASVGWCAAIGLASNLVAGYLPRAGAEEAYVAGTEVAGGSLMPGGRAVRRPDGELVVDGRWPFASGAHHCDWLAGVTVVDGEGGTDACLVLMARRDVELVDTWQVAGLKGTGSVDFQARGLVVPPRRAVSLSALEAWPAGAMWRIPLHSLLLPIMAGVPLGIARAALAELARLAAGKTPFRSTRTLAERDTTRGGVARATAEVDAAEGYLTSTMTALFDAARAGDTPSLHQRAAARLAAVHAAQKAADAVESCYRIAGSTAMFTSSPLQRHLRDVNAATQHYALSHNGYESIGRVLLDFDPDVPL
jgi:alkylation response protein AidB-like acyl-CoA dehydrogenase